MAITPEQRLAHVKESSREQIDLNKASRDDGAAHVRSSRKAIERSLTLLAQPFTKVWDEKR